MNPFARFWYLLTAYVPRPLPATPPQYARLKHVLRGAYGVKDDPRSWITVAGIICSRPPTKLRCPWGHIANAVKRLSIHELAQQDKQVALLTLHSMAKEAVSNEIDRLKAVGEDPARAEAYLRELNGENEAPAPKQPQAQPDAVPAPDTQHPA